MYTYICSCIRSSLTKRDSFEKNFKILDGPKECPFFGMRSVEQQHCSIACTSIQFKAANYFVKIGLTVLTCYGYWKTSEIEHISMNKICIFVGKRYKTTKIECILTPQTHLTYRSQGKALWSVYHGAWRQPTNIYAGGDPSLKLASVGTHLLRCPADRIPLISRENPMLIGHFGLARHDDLTSH